ncbi:desmethylxanthohumol 6'-O-methyltransferase-like [Ziziphus jujuba]|uniref:Desmethylxanthohumol 6'-O-methyltransferase-like n=1 Tax=Ziziphus jujuba TaxID=326968 RepID=A0A6P3ZM02_ZIZJJ|nr:desmethylxanthohumol 6'-O-methyltransferase-like [Ziziphus jujuba]
MEGGKEVDVSALKGQAEIWKHITSGMISSLLKCAVDLRIADIIHNHGGPMTLSEIASKISDAPSLSISSLERVMRLLVYKNIFAAHHPSDGAGETLYGLTDLSKWILWDSKPSLVKQVQLINDPDFMRPWQYLSQRIRDGDTCCNKAFGCTLYEYAATQKPELDQLLTDCYSNTADTDTVAVIDAYKENGGLNEITTLVDVGGRTGKDLHEIIKAHPHIKGINFDLPRVIATAPTYEGVTNVAGDMFDSIPSGDALLLKTTLRDWPDDIVVKILKICRKAIPEKNGKVIIMDVVVEGNNHLLEESHLKSDLSMLVYTGGRDKTAMEWKKLINEAGFPRYKVIKIPAMLSIIEAYPY